MSEVEYDVLAGVYDWLVPDDLLTPEGSVAAFASSIVDELSPGARVLDCAAGTGQLAVGLALRGFEVVATDASGAMIERTRALVAERGVTCERRSAHGSSSRARTSATASTRCCASATHLPTRTGPRRGERRSPRWLPCSRRGGVLVVTSRNWERVRREGSGLRVAERLVERDGRRGLVIYAWDIPDARDDPHFLDVAVALLGDGDAVTTHHERMRFAPFTREELDADLRAAGLEQRSSTYAEDSERYLVTAGRFLRPA